MNIHKYIFRNIRFWGDCVLTVVYLINHLPSSILSDKAPFLLLYNQVPYVTHLHIFGSPCYAIVNHSKHKILMLDGASLLDIHLIIKATNYMILKTTLVLSVRMWFFTKVFFLFMKQHQPHTFMSYQIWSLI